MKPHYEKAVRYNTMSIRVRSTGPAMARQERPRPRRGQTIVEFALTLPLLLLLLFGVIEFGRIFQAWVTLQNAARAAARFATTGQYDTTMFPPGSMDTTWNTSNPPPNGTGLPCPFVNAAGPGTPNQAGVLSGISSFDYKGSPTNAYGTTTGTYDTTWFFREHWGFFCNGGNQDNQYLRQDVFRLVGITKAAQVGAAGLAIGLNSAGNTPLEIPGTGIGTQVTWKQGDTGANLNQNTLLYESENQRGWFHVFICSTRLSLGDGAGNIENVWDNANTKYTQQILPRYYQETDHPYAAGHQNFGLCSVQEGGPDSAHAGGPHAAGTANPFPFSVNPWAPDLQSSCNGSDSACGYKHTGINQYDAGGPGDFVTIIVYFNHPLITPLGLVRDPSTGKDRGFIQLQARRVAINESFRTAKAINLSHPPSNQPSPTPYPSPTITPTFTSSPTNTNTPTFTKTNTATSTFTFTPTQTFTKTQTLTPTATVTPFNRSGDILHEVWENIPGNTIGSLTGDGRYGAAGTGAGTPTSCDFLTQTDGPWNDTGGHDSFGARLSGFIVPPVNDTYTFYMAYNDKGRFFLSNDNTPGNNGWMIDSGVQGPVNNTHQTYAWTSGTVTLQGGYAYFFYVLEKQDTGAYNITLAWNGTQAPLTTRQVITTAYLSRPTAIPSCSAATTTPTPSITYTPSTTLTPSLTLTPSRTLTLTPSLTPSTTLTPSRTLSVTPSLTPSQTLTRTPSLTPSHTATFTPSFTSSPTFTPSHTVTPTSTFTKTSTFTPSPTSNATSTFTNTPTNTSAPPTNTPPPQSTCGQGGC